MPHQVKYWAIVTPGRIPASYILDAYDDERHRHLQAMHDQGATVLGVFDTRAEATDYLHRQFTMVSAMLTLKRQLDAARAAEYSH